MANIALKPKPALPFFAAQLWNNFAISLGLLCVGLLTRIPFRSSILYHWDSVNFSMAFQQFDIQKDQPQPPGYLLYVGLGKLVDLIFHDPPTTLVVISVVASALSIVSLYFLGQAMFDKRTGLIASFLLTFSPLFWFYGEIALPHALDAFLTITCMWWLYEVMEGKISFLYPAITLLAIAGGVRQQTLVFLLPVTFFAMRKVSVKHWIFAGLLGTILCLAWFIPLIAWSGGLTTYFATMNSFSDQFQRTTSIFMGAGWVGLRRNLIKLVLYIAYGWGLASVPFLLMAVIKFRKTVSSLISRKSFFLVIWIAPAFLYYIFVHMGQQGLIFIFLPALLLLSAAAVMRLFDGHATRVIASVVGICLIHSLLFLFLPEYPFGSNSQRFLTRETLVDSDSYFLERFNAIRSQFPSGQTVVISANWHHLDYYLPDYARIPMSIGSKWEVNEGVPSSGVSQAVELSPQELGLVDTADHTYYIVSFDPSLRSFNRTADQLISLKLPHGGSLDYFKISNENQALYLDQNSFGLFQR